MIKSKKSTSIAIALALTLTSSVGFLATLDKVHAQQPTDNIQKKVIVVFKDQDTAKNKGSELKAKGKLKKEFKQINTLTANLSDSEVKELQSDPNILSVEEDSKVTAIMDVQDWGITKIGADKSLTSGLTGTGVKIAVIDTGADLNHPDLTSAIAGGYSAVDYTTSYQDDNGHGTHVAGIIGARNNGTGIVGTAPDASIYAVKALDNNGSGYNSDVIEGINWAIQNRMDIISMSLGSSQGSTALQNACNTAYNKGVLLVAAAGNTGTASAKATQDTIGYPARYTTSVISVGAVDPNNARAYFSSTGKELEVVAPGVNIQSDYLNGQYATMSGTSMATPYVAGDLALLKQANPTLTNVQLRALLDKNVTDLGTKGRDSFFGYGLIKAPVK